MDEQLILSIFMIIGIDLVLGGDNAIVIALACRNLPESKRSQAILFGTILAVVCRIILTIVAVYLLQIPFLQLIGGIFLLYIAFSLLTGEDNRHTIRSPNSLRRAIQTIVVADIVMGFDNTIAIAGAANGHILLVIFGLVISIPIIVWGSGIILHAMNRFPLLIYGGGGILAFTAGKMIAADKTFHAFFLQDPAIIFSLPYMTTGFIIFGALFYEQIKKPST
ncbi:TerC family protein [Bacillus sp. FJAT-47783]|uniref:TerC family protein n=1 Tax=Bacillus sp. FJAT-47783 TaxID=2922712 RepID=UPI001FAC938C|nr:TerC family protein [Bacillus sp. FJAT-47783]